MATVYGVNRTLARTGTVNTIDPEEIGSDVKWLYETYTFLTTEAAGDIIQMGAIDIPVGARIVDWVMDHGDLANNRTLSLGFAGTGLAAVLMAATDCGAAADKKNMTDDGVSLSTGYEITDVTDGGKVILTLAGGAAAAVQVRLMIRFVCKGA
uniref:Uncharacterized protein n=1 Tax=viral metagenome TaxID=1070528 RepID=A0A6M3LG73_9ZZZZ